MPSARKIQSCPIFLRDPHNVIKTFAGYPLERLQLGCLSPQKRFDQRVALILRHSTGDCEHRVVLIQNCHARTDRVHSVWSHPELVGVQGVEGPPFGDLFELLVHRLHLIAQNEKWSRRAQTPKATREVLDARSDYGDGLDGAADPSEPMDILFAVPRSHKAKQSNLVPRFRQITQNIVRA